MDYSRISPIRAVARLPFKGVSEGNCEEMVPRTRYVAARGHAPRSAMSTGSDETRSTSKTAPETPAPDCGTFNVVETQLDLEIKAVQAKTGLGYERSAFLAVEAKVRFKHEGQDPRIRAELEKQTAIVEQNHLFELQKASKRMDEAHKLMAQDPSLTCGAALLRVRELHPDLMQ
jgi:hypothetical protein